MDASVEADPAAARVREAAVPLDRARLLRSLIRAWAAAPENGVGPKEAPSHISLVGADHFRGSQA